MTDMRFLADSYIVKENIESGLTSEFEAALLPELKRAMPDLAAEQQLKGKGKSWLVDLCSKEADLVIEASSRNVVRTGKKREGIQHYEKFYSMLLKLIDIKAAHPSIRPVMVWKNQIPAHSTDLMLCSEWGVYVMSHKDLAIGRVLAGEPPASVNRDSVRFLSRRNEEVKPRWRWLVEQRRNAIVEMLTVAPMGFIEIERALGYRHTRTYSPIRHMVLDLVREGKILKLSPGYARQYGAIYGTDPRQLFRFESDHFEEYKRHKRKDQLAALIMQLLRLDGPMGYRQIQLGLQRRWKIQASREELTGLLSKRLVRKGFVKSEGPPKRAIYSVTSL